MDVDNGGLVVVTPVLSFSRHGLSDWLFQRISALVLALYVLCILSFLYMHHGLSYHAWKQLFHGNAFKVFSTFAMVSLLAHAWIGLWTVFTDYVKQPLLSVFLQISLVLLLLFYLIWGLVILWF